jgi:hypothetical protein
MKSLLLFKDTHGLHHHQTYFMPTGIGGIIHSLDIINKSSSDYEKIPGNVDLLNHDTPLDYSNMVQRKCDSRVGLIVDITEPKVPVFDHDHEKKGELLVGEITYSNAATLDREKLFKRHLHLPVLNINESRHCVEWVGN